MPAMKKLKLSIAAKISRAWPAPTVLLYLTVGSETPAWECGDRSSSFVCSSIYTIDWKLELPILHSQAGAWERARRGSQL